MKHSLLFFLLTFIIVPLFAQMEEAGKYERKSIAYLDEIIRLDGKFVDDYDAKRPIILKELRKQIHMDRFDYVLLPDEVKGDFIEAVENSDEMDFETVSDIIAEKLLPKIKQILVETTAERGEEMLTEAQKNSKIVVKAKELGLSGEQYKRLLNSSYVYIPVINGLYFTKDDKHVTCYVSLGMLWYKVYASEDRVELIKKITPAPTMGLAKTDGHFSGYSSPEEFAFASAVKAAAKNLAVKTKKMKDFKLTAQLVYKSGFKTKVNLGNREGLKLDDKFWFIEEWEDEAGNVKKKKVGYGFVSKLGDTKKKPTAKSDLIIVKGAKEVDEGYVVKEHPRLGIDFSVKYRNYDMELDNKEAREAWKQDKISGIEGNFYFAFGKHMGISQLWFDAGLSAGAGTTEIDEVEFDCNVYQFNFGLLKKMYFGPFILDLGAGYGIRNVTWTYESEGENIEVDNVASGLYAMGGIEVPLGIDFNLQAGVYYNMMGSSEEWTLYTDDTETEWDPDFGMDHSAVNFYIGFVYSLPSLSVDLFSLARGAAGI